MNKSFADEGMLPLRESLKNLTQLSLLKLDFGYNEKFSDEGMRALGESIKHLS